jgi:hypothetical protein
MYESLNPIIPHFHLPKANTYNIEISQSTPGDLSMDCMEMTLLSPVRHHEALKDYESPLCGWVTSWLIKIFHCKISACLVYQARNMDTGVWATHILSHGHYHYVIPSIRVSWPIAITETAFFLWGLRLWLQWIWRQSKPPTYVIRDLHKFAVT